MDRHHDFDSAHIQHARFRLLGSGQRLSRRSIVLGPAILVRPDAGRGPWTLSILEDSPLEPVAHRCQDRLSRTICGFARRGLHHRMAAAIAVPADFRRRRFAVAGRPATAGPHGGDRPNIHRTIYGWALAYRFPDSTGPALVDPDDDVPDLPAFYESPAELIDRVIHLEARGIETRPIALLVHETDFIRDERGGAINRYFPSLTEPGSNPSD